MALSPAVQLPLLAAVIPRPHTTRHGNIKLSAMRL